MCLENGDKEFFLDVVKKSLRVRYYERKVKRYKDKFRSFKIRYEGV